MRVRIALGVFLFTGGIGVAMFLAAGRTDLPFFWAYLGVLTAVMTLALAVADPDLLKERVQPGPGGKDRYIRLKMMPLLLAHYIVAGLDAGRCHWSAGFPRRTARRSPSAARPGCARRTRHRARRTRARTSRPEPCA